jgi:hypothetical protein
MDFEFVFPNGHVNVIPLSFRYYIRLSKFRHAHERTVEERRMDRREARRDYDNMRNIARPKRVRTLSPGSRRTKPWDAK